MKKEVQLSPTTENMPAAMASGNCFANEMANAINLKYFNALTGGRINCPGNEVWYKFTANAKGVHPSGSPGWYTVHTQGSLDTIGYLYDSSGNQLAYNDDNSGNTNFNFWAELKHGQIYYIRVKAHGNATGAFKIRISYFDDEHGNTPASATRVNSVYYNDQSFQGNLHPQRDSDYLLFVPARDCVMEIYTGGTTGTYGTLYNECKTLLFSNDDDGGNNNFKITYHFKAMKTYYIAVRPAVSTVYGDYTLYFKFIKDSINRTSNSVAWINDEYDRDNVRKSITSFIYLNESSGYKYHYEMTKLNVRNEINNLYQSGQEAVLTELLVTKLGVSSNFVLSTGIGILVKMINNFAQLEGQIKFENQLDQVIQNKKGFVRCANTTLKSGIIMPTYTPVTSYYYEHDGGEFVDSTYIYGAIYNRGHFSKY